MDEIRNIDVGSGFSATFAGESLAALEEILDIVPSEVILNVEIKNIPIIHQGIEDILLDCLKNQNREDNVIISSFDHEALQKVQARASFYPIGLLFYYRFIRPWEYAKQTGLDVYSIHPNAVYLTKELIDEFHHAGYKVYPYTVNKMEDYEKIMEAGADGVFFQIILPYLVHNNCKQFEAGT